MESNYQPKTYRPGREPVSAADLNARGRELMRLGRMTAGQGIGIQSDSAGVMISTVPGLKILPVKITGHGTVGANNEEAHSWKEQQPLNDGTGGWQDVTNGLTGDVSVSPMVRPLYHPNLAIFDNDTVVLAMKSVSRVDSGKIVEEWLVLGSGGGSGSALTVKESDGTPTVADVDTLVLHSDSFVLTDDTGGQVTQKTKGLSVTKTVVIDCDEGIVTIESWQFTNGLLTSIT